MADEAMRKVLTLAIEQTGGTDWAPELYAVVVRDGEGEKVLASAPTRYYVEAEAELRRMKQVFEEAVESIRRNLQAKE